jgi:ligand-binding sensor domain-containing protein
MVFLPIYSKADLMKTNRFSALIFLLAAGGMIFLPSCKEKNDEFPPRSWSEYSYTSATIASRTISAMLYENDHSLWLGSAGSEGMLHQNGYRWNIYDQTKTGIAFDSVQAIIRDGNANLWIAWENGLASFDGTTWEKIPSFDGLNVTSVTTVGIGDVVAGIKGKSGGIAWLKNNEWNFYTLLNSEIPSGNINDLVSDQNQVLWLATADKGVVRLKNNTWDTMLDDNLLISENFTCITEASDGSIWAASAASQLIHFENDSFTILNTGTSKPVSCIVITDDGSVWCGTLGGGLIHYDGKQWTSFTKENADLPSNEILSLVKGSPGNLILSIPGGQILIFAQ